ncbi:hypothetical protein DIE14_02345 [Burkholderia sp. Bp9017]|nr:hypothetical protein DIE14_02345 [Burkholderia sp. Bp9017]RQZ37897.1 hypothetical protein DIE13_02335 [Burkholderia sp. Bp9016]
MDFSPIWNTGTAVVSGIAALAGGALGMFVKGIDARQKLAAFNRELQEAKDEAQVRRAVAVRAEGGWVKCGIAWRGISACLLTGPASRWATAA